MYDIDIRRDIFRRRFVCQSYCNHCTLDNAACRSNRAASLTVLGRLAEAVRDCDEAVWLDPGYSRVHQWLASLHLHTLQLAEQHLNKCLDAMRIGDWKSAMREGDVAIAAGAYSFPQLFTCRAEALLKLHSLVDAGAGLSNIPKFE
ncbi:hypothetical protein IFM89_028787 [Coptis chinensis]|uniref:Uncharacterized protein n=1 Tax=Coptis chinensis TaxID=261450 RepID=A0A835LEV2_9MAGN|nr:hypothetical protein IFM89_028787 [Coptis chinensis]